MADKVCCIVVTYNIGQRFYKCFNSVINQVDGIIIIDNGSTGETINVLKHLESYNKVTVVYNNENLGIAAALNIGVDIAIRENYDWILTMDNDSEATVDMVKSMFNWLESYEDKQNVMIIFPDYIEKKLIKEYSKCNSSLNNYKIENVYFDNTSGNLVRTEVFKKVGKFKEELFIDSVDHDFCLRVKQNHGKLIKVKNAKLLHNLGNVRVINFFGKKIHCSNHSAIRRYYITRNRCLMRKLYADEEEYIKYDRKTFINENIKILLFENDKINKLRMSIRGYRDYTKGKFGRIDID